MIFPTETLYGIAARVDMLGAVGRLSEIKGRPAAKPIPVMVMEKRVVYGITTGADERFERLADYFWPGPLTMVLSKNHIIDNVITAGTRSVAIRIPSHELPLALLNALPIPLAVTSANLSGDEPLEGNELVESFKNEVDAIVLGDTGRYELASTVVDLTSTIPRILRRGAVDRERIEACLTGLCKIT